MTDIRCPSILQAILDTENQTIEFKCKRRRCGAGPEVVVLHTFSLISGELIQTRRFRNPIVKGRTDGAS